MTKTTKQSKTFKKSYVSKKENNDLRKIRRDVRDYVKLSEEHDLQKQENDCLKKEIDDLQKRLHNAYEYNKHSDELDFSVCETIRSQNTKIELQNKTEAELRKKLQILVKGCVALGEINKTNDKYIKSLEKLKLLQTDLIIRQEEHIAKNNIA